jgi:hypothetical protein
VKLVVDGLVRLVPLLLLQQRKHVAPQHIPLLQQHTHLPHFHLRQQRLHLPQCTRLHLQQHMPLLQQQHMPLLQQQHMPLLQQHTHLHLKQQVLVQGLSHILIVYVRQQFQMETGRAKYYKIKKTQANAWA